MITWVFAIFSSACSSMQSAFTKLGSKVSPNIFGFNAAKTGSAFLIFILLSLGGFACHTNTVLFASIYAVSLILGTFCGYMALMKGSMALSALIASFSVVIPVIYGIGFLNEAAYPIKIVGIVLLFVSLLLFSRKSGNKNFSKSWLVYIAITFLCNGISSVIQKQHQIIYPGLYIKEFTIISFGIIFAFFLLMAVFKKEKPEKGSVKFALPAGLAMGGMNFLTLTLSQYMDASVLFPVVTVCSSVFNFIVSMIVFKEKFTTVQLCGILLGVVSVVLIK